MKASMLIFGLLTVIAAGGVVFSKKTLNSALFLVLTFFLVSVHYALLGADFLAVLQILVYAGAIMVLVIFVIMLLGLNEPAELKKSDFPKYFFGALTAGIFIGMIYFMLNPDTNLFNQNSSQPPSSPPGTPAAIGDLLFTKFLFPFEVTSVLLLAAIVGAVVLANEPKRPLSSNRGLKAMRNK